jgi:hypothetical protein
VDQDLYDKVQAIIAGRYQPARNDGTVRSPLAGLIKCANCGQNMQRMVMKKQPYLLCTRAGCCAAAQFSLVEDRLLDYLETVLAQLTLTGSVRPQDTAAQQLALDAAQKELAAAQRQKSRLYELLETGEYDVPTFRERMAAVRDKIATLEKREHQARQALTDAQITDPGQLAARIQAVLDAYSAADAAGKNALLKSVVDVAWYRKAKKTKPLDFSLDVHLKPI